MAEGRLPFSGLFTSIKNVFKGQKKPEAPKPLPPAKPKSRDLTEPEQASRRRANIRHAHRKAVRK